VQGRKFSRQYLEPKDTIAMIGRSNNQLSKIKMKEF
jgi:hypothetical protein